MRINIKRQTVGEVERTKCSTNEGIQELTSIPQQHKLLPNPPWMGSLL